MGRSCSALPPLLLYWANGYGVIFTDESLDALQHWMAHEQELALEERELAAGRKFHHALHEAARAAAESERLLAAHGTVRDLIDSQGNVVEDHVYHAAIGKFLSDDPIGFRTGDANRSRYVGSQSVAATDPDGPEIKRVKGKSGNYYYQWLYKGRQRLTNLRIVSVDEAKGTVTLAGRNLNDKGREFRIDELGPHARANIRHWKANVQQRVKQPAAAAQPGATAQPAKGPWYIAIQYTTTPKRSAGHLMRTEKSQVIYGSSEQVLKRGTVYQRKEGLSPTIRTAIPAGEFSVSGSSRYQSDVADLFMSPSGRTSPQSEVAVSVTFWAPGRLRPIVAGRSESVRLRIFHWGSKRRSWNQLRVGERRQVSGSYSGSLFKESFATVFTGDVRKFARVQMLFQDILHGTKRKFGNSADKVPYGGRTGTDKARYLIVAEQSLGNITKRIGCVQVDVEMSSRGDAKQYLLTVHPASAPGRTGALPLPK